MTAPAAPQAGVGTRTPPAVAVAWFLLLVNTLGYTAVDLVVPFPRELAQVVTMGALAAAFVIALVLNPRVRVRPSGYLLLLSLLTLVSVVASLQLQAGLGAVLRCVRLTLFVATLWLLSRWWQGGTGFVVHHLRALVAVLSTVLAGLVLSPGGAFSGPDGRLVGAVWPIPAPQVGLYCAIAIGLVVLLWAGGRVDGRSCVLVVAPATVLLLLSHTRTALLGLVVALLVALVSSAARSRRARRVLALAGVLGVGVAAVAAPAIVVWLQRGQDGEEIGNLTGRVKVWDLLIAEQRTLAEQLLGIGLTDKSFGGLPIDNNWLAVYHEQGWVGVVLVAAMLGGLLLRALLARPSLERNCALFLVLYSAIASYTEVGLGDASPYLLGLAVAAAVLSPAPVAATERPGQSPVLPSPGARP